MSMVGILKRYDQWAGQPTRQTLRIVVAWFSALLIAVNITAAGFLPPMPAISSASDALAGMTTICTSTGMIAIDADGRLFSPSGDIEHPESDSGHGALCAFCLPILHGAVLAPALTGCFVGLTFSSRVTPLLPSRRVLTAILLPGAASPRAPPSV